MELNEHEKKLLRQKDYREKNREVLRAKFRLYYHAKRDEINERRRQVYLEKKKIETEN